MKMKKYLRQIVQLLILLGLTYLFLSQNYERAAHPFFTWTGWQDPLLGLAALIQNQWPWLILVSIGAIILAAYAGRFFCGWICPVGTVLDILLSGKHLLKLPEWRPEKKTKQILNYIRWILLGIVTGLVLCKWFIALVLNPLVLWPRELFRLFSGLFPWSLVALLGLGLFIFPRFWCRYLCPTGSLINLACRFRKKRYIIGTECRQCGICIRKCPMQNINSELQVGTDCLHCGQCIRICQVGCVIKLKDAPKTISESRRDFLIGTAAGLSSLAVTALTQSAIIKPATFTPKRWPRLLRPPGALTEEKLAVTCTRCGQCLGVCPTKVLIPAGLEANLNGLWTPRFVPRLGRCMFCMACGQVCPTKALVPVQMRKTKLGQAKIDKTKCLAWAKNTKCLLCAETCPTFSIRINADERPEINLNTCNGCGSCEAHCPVEGSAVLLTYFGETRRN